MPEHRINLDTPTACRQELERVSTGLVELTREYQTKRERLGNLNQHLGLARDRLLVGMEGANKEEREAKVRIALREGEETSLLEGEERELETELDILQQRIRTLEKRGTHAQSAARTHEADRFGGGV